MIQIQTAELTEGGEQMSESRRAKCSADIKDFTNAYSVDY